MRAVAPVDLVNVLLHHHSELIPPLPGAERIQRLHQSTGASGDRPLRHSPENVHWGLPRDWPSPSSRQPVPGTSAGSTIHADIVRRPSLAQTRALGRQPPVPFRNCPRSAGSTRPTRHTLCLPLVFHQGSPIPSLGLPSNLGRWVSRSQLHDSQCTDERSIPGLPRALWRPIPLDRSLWSIRSSTIRLVSL